MMNVFISLQRHLVCHTNLLLGTVSNTALEVTQPVPVLDPTQLLSLNCFVLGDDLKKVFTVEVEKTKNVSILKKVIKEENAPRLDHVVAMDLDLFRVSLPRDGDLDATLQSTQPLDSLLPLSDVFPHVEEDHLHILILAPTNGELIWAESDGLIDIVQRVQSSQEKRRGEIRSVLCIKVCTISFSLAIFD
jgi:hypothetical protein